MCRSDVKRPKADGESPGLWLAKASLKKPFVPVLVFSVTQDSEGLCLVLSCSSTGSVLGTWVLGAPLCPQKEAKANWE